MDLFALELFTFLILDVHNNNSAIQLSHVNNPFFPVFSSY